MAGANALGFDYGATVANVESIKTARLNREIGQNALNQSRQNDPTIAGSRAATAEGMRADIVAGEPGAEDAYVTFDPEGAAAFLATLQGMDESKLSETQANVDLMGRTAAFVLGSDDPAAAWATVRGQLTPEMQAKMPEQYNEQMARWLLAQATDMSTMIENVATHDEAASGETDGQPIKSADSNSIARAVNNLFGGTYTQTGDGNYVFTGLAKGEEQRAASVMAEASKIYRTNSGISHAEAVQQAASKFGFTFPVEGGTGANGQAEPAPRDPAQRQVGGVYLAPDGRLGKWLGNGFEWVE